MTMSFRADVPSIRLLASRLADLTDDADSAAGYVRRHLDVSSAEDGMFFNYVSRSVTQVQDSLERRYQHLARLMDLSGSETQAAADFYRDTDTEAAARLDATY
jgi:hypothetical protein